MKDCVLLSSWIQDKSYDLGKYYIDTLHKYHTDSDVFIGVNSGSCDKWIYTLEDARIKYKVYSGENGIDSDVTGFMMALDLYKKTDRNYRNIWFTHTKGSSYINSEKSLGYRNYLEKNFWGKKDQIDYEFEHNNIGLMYNDIIIHENPNIDKVLNSMYDFKINNINFFVQNTFFVTDISINKFIDSDKFNIETINKREDRRYFFEAYFCIIPSKMGRPHKQIRN